MTTKVSPWGNSLGVRIPKPFLMALQLSAGDSVKVEQVGDQIVIKATDKKTLEQLLSGITAENRPELLLDSPLIGREVW